MQQQTVFTKGAGTMKHKKAVAAFLAVAIFGTTTAVCQRGGALADFVLVPGGTVIGRNPPWLETDTWISASTRKDVYGVFIRGRTVTISPFYMSKYEVTQDEYWQVMAGQTVTVDGIKYTLDAEPSYCKAGSAEYAVRNPGIQGMRPVEGISWFDAVWYCNARSEREGLEKAYDIVVEKVMASGHIYDAAVTLVRGANGYRLPTESEWEYAARGGNPNAREWNYAFAGANTGEVILKHWNLRNSVTGATIRDVTVEADSGLDKVGWYSNNNLTGVGGRESYGSFGADASGKGTHAVGLKAPNSLGLYDMSGNVAEWCWDCSGEIPTGAATDPTGPVSGSLRVYRGGNWSNIVWWAFVTMRSSVAPYHSNDGLGFRVVRNAQ